MDTYQDTDDLTVREAAKVLNVSIATIYGFIDDGKLAFLDYSKPNAVKKTIRINYKALRLFMESRLKPATISK